MLGDLLHGFGAYLKEAWAPAVAEEVVLCSFQRGRCPWSVVYRRYADPTRPAILQFRKDGLPCFALIVDPPEAGMAMWQQCLSEVLNTAGPAPAAMGVCTRLLLRVMGRRLISARQLQFKRQITGQAWNDQTYSITRVAGWRRQFVIIMFTDQVCYPQRRKLKSWRLSLWDPGQSDEGSIQMRFLRLDLAECRRVEEAIRSRLPCAAS